MKRMYRYIFLIFLFSICSCKKYKRTSILCDKKLFVEVFETNPFGIDTHFLTDSTTFRICVGKIDNEHQNYQYSCNGDTLRIERFGMEQMDITGRLLETKFYLISALSAKKNL